MSKVKDINNVFEFSVSVIFTQSYLNMEFNGIFGRIEVFSSFPDGIFCRIKSKAGGTYWNILRK
jgi:hypothetical protein